MLYVRGRLAQDQKSRAEAGVIPWLKTESVNVTPPMRSFLFAGKLDYSQQRIAGIEGLNRVLSEWSVSRRTRTRTNKLFSISRIVGSQEQF